MLKKHNFPVFIQVEIFNSDNGEYQVKAEYMAKDSRALISKLQMIKTTSNLKGKDFKIFLIVNSKVNKESE
mgnify:CR=1 FL=1